MAVTTDDLIRMDEIAERLGVHPTALIRVYRKIPGFPPSRVVKARMWFERQAALSFIAANQPRIRALMKAARDAQTAEGRHITPFNAAALRFVTGEFATAEQKREREFRRLVARNCKPKTVRVRLVPDWCRD